MDLVASNSEVANCNQLNTPHLIPPGENTENTETVLIFGRLYIKKHTWEYHIQLLPYSANRSPEIRIKGALGSAFGVV